MQVLNNYDAKSACEQFFTNFDREYDTSFPIKSKILTYKDILKPWIDDTAIKRIKIRSNLKNLQGKKSQNPKLIGDLKTKSQMNLTLPKLNILNINLKHMLQILKKNMGSNQQCYKIQKSSFKSIINR